MQCARLALLLRNVYTPGLYVDIPSTQYIVRLFGWARKYVGLRMGEPGREEERSARKSRRSVDGSVEWMGAWTGAAARERHYLLDETLPAHSGAPLSPSLVRWRLFPLHRAITTLASSVNFLDGVMRYANGRCMLDYIRVLVEFISQHEYKDLILMFGIVNEVLTQRRNYLQAHNMIRDGRWQECAWGAVTGGDCSLWHSRTRAYEPTPPKLTRTSFALASMGARLVLLDEEGASLRRNIDRSRTGRRRVLSANTFMATDPRDSVGVVKDPFDGVFSARLSSGPPLPIQNLTHIATASVASLAFVTPVVGCTYPDTWSAIGSPVPEFQSTYRVLSTLDLSLSRTSSGLLVAA
ncbi:hypothetical protein B0H13DRAFT_2556234 [Mycena leptocephala]|nr:hypothetical protein B0H13DRAFT_2556234 [Mycena leptocephala]